jgi:Zn finger protein HypA/HybF involved in hydrogenase expression
MFTKRKLRKCKRCNWQWFTKQEKTYSCPKCHSPKWNVPKEIAKSQAGD